MLRKIKQKQIKEELSTPEEAQPKVEITKEVGEKAKDDEEPSTRLVGSANEILSQNEISKKLTTLAIEIEVIYNKQPDNEITKDLYNKVSEHINKLAGV